MKTFETEKHSIPCGATHYQDESSSRHFAWFKDMNNDVCKIMIHHSDKWREVDNKRYMLHAKPIPQTKEVEWENGKECRYANDIEHEYIYIGEHPHGDGHYVFSEEKGITYIANGYLLEPETPEQRKEREELEAAYYLYCIASVGNQEEPKSIEHFLNHEYKKAWLIVVRETGYRVEK